METDAQEFTRVNAEIANLNTATAKLQSEIVNLNAQTEKLHAETYKIQREAVFFPIFGSGALIAAIAAVIKLFFKLKGPALTGPSFGERTMGARNDTYLTIIAMTVVVLGMIGLLS